MGSEYNDHLALQDTFYLRLVVHFGASFGRQADRPFNCFFFYFKKKKPKQNPGAGERNLARERNSFLQQSGFIVDGRREKR